MPKYKYRCADCDVVFEAIHSIKEKLNNCFTCGVVDSLQRIPYNITTKINKNITKMKVGDVVKEKIEEFKKDLKKQKTDLKNEEFTKK